MNNNFVVQMSDGLFLGVQGKTEFISYAIHFSRVDACEASLKHVGARVLEVKPVGQYSAEATHESSDFHNHIAGFVVGAILLIAFALGVK